MQVRSITAAAVASSFLAVFAAREARAYDYTAPVQFHPVATFDPANGVVPFPNNLLLLGSTDLTLNIPVDDPGNFGDPKVAMNTLDGFSTVAPWTTTFNMPLDATSLAGGDSVRVFQVTLTGPGGAVTGVVRELSSPEEFVVALAPSDTTGRTLAIVPTQPLEQMSSYMAVLTNGIKNAAGTPIRASLPYLLAERTSPLCSGGNSTVPALPASQACALEPLRQLTNAQEAAATAAGVPAGSITLSWTMTTQSTSVVTQTVDAIVEASPPADTTLAPTGRTLADLGLGLRGVADIWIGVIALPYYLSAPSEDDPTAPLTKFWKGAPGAYIEQCAGFGLDPDSTNLTYCNPVPVATSTQLVPVVMTIPNASSGHSKPAAGWPIVIYQHRDLPARHHAQPHRRVRDRGHARGAGLCGHRDRPAAARHHRYDDPFYHRQHAVRATRAHRSARSILDLQSNASGAPGPTARSIRRARTSSISRAC